MTLSGRLFGGIDRKVRESRKKKKAVKKRRKPDRADAKSSRATEIKKDAAMRAEARKRREAYFKSRKR